MITLSPTSFHEADALFPIFSDAEVVKYTNFEQQADVPSLRNFLERFLGIQKGQPLQYGPYTIYVNEEPAGLCGLQQKDLAAGTSELWYILGKKHWGKGFARQAVGQLLKECSSNKKLKTILAEAVCTNYASWQILEKAGFMKTHEIQQGFKKKDMTEDLCYYSYNCIK